MSKTDDEIVDIDLPFFHIHIGSEGRHIRFGSSDGEDVIDMESNDSGEYRAVRKRVRARLRFFRHAFFFVAANSIFFLIDWSTGGGYWVQWVAGLWGIFLAWEFISTFVAPLLWGRDVEERMIQRELRRRRGA